MSHDYDVLRPLAYPVEAKGSATFEDEILPLLTALVKTNTVNPPGNEGPAAILVGSYLAEKGFDVNYYEDSIGRPSVVARLTASRSGPRLLFNGHLDTMPPGSGWKRDPFSAVVEQDNLYGCGAFDMKAGVAAMVVATSAFARTCPMFNGELIVTAVPDEIAGGARGSGHLVRNELVKADMAVVCEPTGEQVFVAHRGALWLEITVRGKSAHGGRPWLGINAISKATKIIRALETRLPEVFSTKIHPRLPSPTLNVGLIKGGDRANLVPDTCVITVDRRMIPGELASDAESEIRAAVEQVIAEDAEDWTASVTTIGVVDAAEVNVDTPIVKECQRAYQDVTNRKCGINATAGFEDAHYFIHAGIPTAMFGPYVPGIETEDFVSLAGMAEEHVSISRVVEAANIYHRLCQNVLLAQS